MKSTFVYRGWNLSNKVVSGTIRADDPNDATRSIVERGIRPISIETLGSTFRIRNWFVKKPPERIAFFRSLASLMGAGVPANVAFNMLVNQADGSVRAVRSWIFWKKRSLERFFRTIEQMRTEIGAGSKISAAMARRPDDFTDVEVAMVSAGEKAGHQEKVVANLAAYLEKDRKFRKALSSAMIYPVLVSCMAVVIVGVLSVFVVPKFVNFYKGFDVPLPLSLKIFMGISIALRNPIFDFVSILTVVAGAWFALKSLETTAGAMVFDRARMSIPVVGELLRKNVMVAISNVLRMLLDAGEGPVEALDTMTQITDSPIYARAIITARNELVDGRVAKLHDALADTGEFDSFYLGYLKIGDKAGNAPEMLSKVSEHYEGDVESLVARIPVIVNALMIMILGVVVASIIIPLYSSIVNLSSQIH